MFPSRTENTPFGSWYLLSFSHVYQPSKFAAVEELDGFRRCLRALRRRAEHQRRQHTGTQDRFHRSSDITGAPDILEPGCPRFEFQVLCSNVPSIARRRTAAELRCSRITWSCSATNRCPFGGTASPGEQVAVTFDGSVERTSADGAGRWKVTLPSHAAGGPYTLTAAGDGSVWSATCWSARCAVASGTVEHGLHAFAGDHGQTGYRDGGRSGVAAVYGSESDRARPVGRRPYVVDDSQSGHRARFSAVAYYFGRDLRRKLGVPVGIIHTSWPGTQAEEWTTLAALKLIRNSHRSLLGGSGQRSSAGAIEIRSPSISISTNSRSCPSPDSRPRARRSLDRTVSTLRPDRMGIDGRKLDESRAPVRQRLRSTGR